MKVFLIGIGSLFAEHNRAAALLAKEYQILYWVRIRDFVHLDESEFPKTIFHDYRDALRNIPPREFQNIILKPWNAREIREHYETESELLSMMDKWYPEWPVNKRKDFYYDLLSYWDTLLEKLKPDAVIFHAPPHEMFSYVLFHLAKARGIKTPMFDCILAQDRVILSEDYREGNPILAQEAAKGFTGTSAIESLSPEIRAYYEEVSQSANPAPAYVAAWKVEALGLGKLRRRARALLPFIKDGSIVERAAMRFFKMLKPGVIDEQKKYQKSADLSKPYVYVPLHYQPECTTSPQGGVFVGQILMIKILSAALPQGWELYVKEHPAQTEAHGNDYTPFRYPGFFRAIAELPRVRLIPTNTNTFELTKHARAVATIAGTAAWEAVLRGTPALVFGYPWFMHAPGVLRVSSVEECEEAFAKIEKEFVPGKQSLINYLAAVEKNSFRGYTSGYGKKVAALDEETAMREMHRALKAALIL